MQQPAACPLQIPPDNLLAPVWIIPGVRPDHAEGVVGHRDVLQGLANKI